MRPIDPSVSLSDSSAHMIVSRQQDPSNSKDSQVAQVETFKTPSLDEDQDKKSKMNPGIQLAAQYYQIIASLTRYQAAGQPKLYRLTDGGSRSHSHAPGGAIFRILTWNWIRKGFRPILLLFLIRGMPERPGRENCFLMFQSLEHSSSTSAK